MSCNIFIWNFKIGGVQKHTVLLANYLVSKSWDVQLLCASMEGDLLGMLDSRVKTLTFRIPNTNNPLRLIQLYFRLKKVLPKSSIVLCNGPNNFRQVSRVNLIFKRWKLLYILQNDLEIEKSLASFWKEFEMRLLCNSARTNIVALSEVQKKEHRKRLGIRGVTVIPNFIDFNHPFLSSPKVDEPKRGVSIGRYADQKGYDILLKAMKLVDKGIHIDVYGFGDSERQKLVLEAQRDKITNIRFKDSVLNVTEVMAGYDFFVLPSRFEPFGIVVAEALSCGLPVVTTDCDGPSEIINEKNGIVVKKENPVSLAEGIGTMHERVLNGYYLPSDIRESSEKYSIEKVALDYVNCVS